MKRVLLVAGLVLFIWLGSGAISYTVVELTGGGSPGIQGEQGEQGQRGERGLTGSAAEPASGLLDNPCGTALASYRKGLETPGLSEQQISSLYGRGDDNESGSNDECGNKCVRVYLVLGSRRAYGCGCVCAFFVCGDLPYYLYVWRRCHHRSSLICSLSAIYPYAGR